METVSERSDGRPSIRHAMTLAGLADWHCRLGEFESGRRRFRRSIERLRNEDDEHLIGALLGLARCSFDELAGEGIATSLQSLDPYRGPVLRRRMSIGSPAFRFRVQRFCARRRRGDAACGGWQRARVAAGAPRPRAAASRRLVSGEGSHPRGAAYYASAQRWSQRTIVADDPLFAPVQVLYPVPALALRNPSRARPWRRNASSRSSSRCAPTDTSSANAWSRARPVSRRPMKRYRR